jgi:hypothetical protein
MSGLLALPRTPNHSEHRKGMQFDEGRRPDMVRIEGSTVIARPVEVVFDFVADERNTQ